MPKPMPGSPNTPKLLKAWRKKKGCTQIEAAALLGVPVGTYRDWEQGRFEPPAVGLRSLAELIAD